MITVFTPTYNRAYTLQRLYDSLCLQTSKNFEWVIVDDGSTDDTKSLVEAFMNENKINIRYFYQDNAGKPSAHNRGVREAKGELFTCVDSDDFLTIDAVKLIEDNWKSINNNSCIGIVAFRKHIDELPITRIKDREIQYSTLHKLYKKHGMSGDTMLIYRTDIIKQFKFPIISGEKFIPEGYLYNKLDQVGEIYILRKGTYICEYLEDGYTKNVSKLIFNNYKGYVLHINARIKSVDSAFEKILDSIRYDSVMIAHHESKIIKLSEVPFLALIGYIPGLIIAKKRYGTLMKRSYYVLRRRNNG